MSESNLTWDRAIEAYRAGHFQRADQLCVELLDKDPKNVQVLHFTCMVAYSIGDVPLHVDRLKRLVSMAPNHVQSLNALANIFRDQGSIKEATELAQRAIQVAPRYANAHNTLGLCYEDLDRWEEAVGCFERALGIQPDIPAIYVNLGAALQHLGRMAEATAFYQRAAELSPDNAEAYEGLGHAYAHERRRGEALRCYTRALELTPNSVHRLLLVAEFKVFYGLIDESLALVERALSLDPLSARSHLFYGFRMQDLGNFDAALSSFQKSIELEPEQGEAYLGLALSKRLQEEDQPLVDEIGRLIHQRQMRPTDLILLHTALGKAYEDWGEFERSVRHIDEANRIAIEKNGDTPIFNRGEFETYVDNVITTFTPEFISERRDWAVDTELPILIIGLPRSGTTLTEQILSNHPQISPAGEQPFWSDVNTNKQIVTLAHRKDETRSTAIAYEKLLRSFGPNARFVTDKRPDNFCFIGIIHMLFPNARFIHCRRQLIDNCLSLYLTPFRMRTPFQHTREDILFYAEQYERLMNHWRKLLPRDRILDVNYEEMVADQEGSIHRMLEFCRLDWDDACLRPEENRRPVSSPSNWQTRQAIYKTSVERWRRYEPWLGAFRALIPEKTT